MLEIGHAENIEWVANLIDDDDAKLNISSSCIDDIPSAQEALPVFLRRKS